MNLVSEMSVCHKEKLKFKILKLRYYWKFCHVPMQCVPTLYYAFKQVYEGITVDFFYLFKPHAYCHSDYKQNSFYGHFKMVEIRFLHIVYWLINTYSEEHNIFFFIDSHHVCKILKKYVFDFILQYFSYLLSETNSMK